MKRVHLHIEGLVQGVCYRAFARDEAESLRLSGWVRNLPDGRVELVAEGPEEALQKLVAWCRRGPPAAHVLDMAVRYAEATGEFIGFRVAR